MTKAKASLEREMGETTFKLNDRDRKVADFNIDWICIDCGTNTAPGVDMAEFERNPDSAIIIDEHSEVYWVLPRVWQLVGNPEGSLCIGCLETRLGRWIKRKEFLRGHPFNHPTVKGTPRLLARRRKST